MPLDSAALARLTQVAIDANNKDGSTDSINTPRPLLDALMPKAQKLVVGPEGATESVYMDNGTTTQIVSGNSTHTYQIQDQNRKAKYDYMFVHNGFTVSEDELFRVGIRISDGKSASSATTYDERVQIVDMLREKHKGLKEAQRAGVHQLLWLDGTQIADAKQGIDAFVSTTPTAGTIEGLPASATWWQNGATIGITPTLSTFQTQIAKLNRNVKKFNGSVTHYFAGGDMLDSLRTQAISANQTQINYEGGGMLRYDYAHDGIFIDGKPVIYVPDFDNNFGLAAPPVPWPKRLYGLNLEKGAILRKDKDFLNERDAGRPIDQYTYYMAMTSKFALSMKQRNTNWVLSIA